MKEIIAWFKGLPTWGKFTFVAVAVLVVWYVWKKGAGTSSSSSNALSLAPSTAMSGGTLVSSGGTQSTGSTSSTNSQTQIGNLTSEVNSLKSAQSTLGNKYTSLQKSNQALQGKYNVTTQQLQAQQQADAKLQTQLSTQRASSQGQINTLTGQVNTYKSQLSQAKASQAKSAKTISALQQQLRNQSSTPSHTSTPTHTSSKPIRYKLEGTDYYNSTVWGLSKMYLIHHGNGGKGIKNPTNAQVSAQVNKVKKLNPGMNVNKVQKNAWVTMAKTGGQ